MNIREELLKYQVQSRENALRIASFAASAESDFKELINCFLSDDRRLAQRAAWCVSWSAGKKPEMIQPYLHSLVNQLGRTDVHDAVIRNSLRILKDADIPEEHHGKILSACFDYIQKRETPVAVKAFSLHILYNFIKIYPDIKNELKLIILENIDYETAAYKSIGKKILNRI